MATPSSADTAPSGGWSGIAVETRDGWHGGEETRRGPTSTRFRESSGYLESEFHMSWLAFHVPSLCLDQVQRNLPFSTITLPSGPLIENS